MNTTMNNTNTNFTDRNVYGYLGERISWGSIVAGALVALAVHVVLAALGAGIGLTAYDPLDGDTVGQGTMIAAGIFGVVATIVAMASGGYVAGKLAGVVERVQVGLHGLVMWAVTTVFVLTGLAFGAGTAFAGMARSFGIQYGDFSRMGSGALASTDIPAVAERALNAGAMSTWFAFLTLVVSAVASVAGAMMAMNYFVRQDVREPRARTSYKTSGATAGL